MFLKTFLLILFCSLLNSADIKVGYDTSVFQNISKKDVALSTDLWFQTIIDKKKYTTSFKIYDNPKTLAKSFKNKMVNLVVTQGPNLIKYYDKKDLLPAFTAGYINPEDQYLIVVTKKPYKNTWEKLSSPKVGILQQSNLQKIFFEYHFLKENKNNKITFTEFPSSSRALLNLFFDKLDCVIIPYRSYKTVTELNPQIKTKVVIAQKTKLTSLVFAVYRNETDPKMLEDVNNGIIEFINTERMKRILKLYKMEFLQKTDLSRLDAIKELLKKHTQLMESLKQ